MTYTIEMARALLDNAGCAFLQTERGKCLKSIVEQLAEANAHASRLQDRLAEVQAEKSDALIAVVEELSDATKVITEINGCLDFAAISAGIDTTIGQVRKLITENRKSLALYANSKIDLAAVIADRDALKAEDGGLVDQFIHRLVVVLESEGINMSACDGEDEPEIVIGHFLAARIKDAEAERDESPMVNVPDWVINEAETIPACQVIKNGARMPLITALSMASIIVRNALNSRDRAESAISASQQEVRRLREAWREIQTIKHTIWAATGTCQSDCRACELRKILDGEATPAPAHSDTERLDWLQIGKPRQVYHFANGATAVDSESSCHDGPNIRAAIDSAIDAELAKECK